MADLTGGLIGCGFFAQNHLHGWQEIQGARIDAVCDLDRGRAEEVADAFGIDHVYEDAARMLEERELDFVDIVTRMEAHAELVGLAAEFKVPVICQKPLAPSLEEARSLVGGCERAGVPLMVHENFRWQRPMRAVARAAGEIGDLFFARISFRSGYDVYVDQPYLAERERFIILDLGIHLLDLARFFLGEFDRLSCETRRVNPKIEGEDVATVLLASESRATAVVELSYASHVEEEHFPETFVRLEGSEGTVELGPDFQLTVVRSEKVQQNEVAPRSYAWSSDPGRAIQDSVVAVQQHWTDCLMEGVAPETTGQDNLRTLELVFGAYESAECGQTYETRLLHR